jgi:hypothetical protein
MVGADIRSDSAETGGAQSNGEDRSAFTEGSALRRWILISGNRFVVSAIVLSLAGVGLVAFGTIWTDELTKLFTETQVIQTLLIALFSGIILLVSIAVSVNSIVLSQEITSLGEQVEQVDETFEFRDSVQDHTDANVAPVRPAAFLRVIFRGIRTNAEALFDDASRDDATFYEQVSILVDDIVRQVDAVEDRLEQGSFGTSEVLLAGIRYDYSWQVYAVRRLRTEHDDVLTDAQRESIDELLTVLKYFTIGREYFKTLYFKRELANLSRGLLALSFPALVYLSYAILALRAGLLPEVSVFGIPSIVLFVGLTYTIGLAPYTVFSAYVLRSATTANMTLAAGPFILDTDDKRGRIDWETDDVAGQ